MLAVGSVRLRVNVFIMFILIITTSEAAPNSVTIGEPAVGGSVCRGRCYATDRMLMDGSVSRVCSAELCYL